MHLKIASLVLGLLFSIQTAYNQSLNKVWYGGGVLSGLEPDTPDRPQYYYLGMNTIHFQPIQSQRTFKALSVSDLLVNICDTNGNLIFYSNGSKVFNAKHRLIENGDSLNYSRYWANNYDGYYGLYINGLFSQSLIAIPDPYRKGLYYLIATYYDWGSTHADNRVHTKMMYSVLDMSANGDDGRVILKEKTIAEGNFMQGIFATKHSNGRDWWLLVRNNDGTGCFNRMFLDSTGIHLLADKDCLGYKYTSVIDTIDTDVSKGNFSPDGRYFAMIKEKGLELFRFDRCRGRLSDVQMHDYPLGDTNYNQNEEGYQYVYFSPNSKLLYVNYASRVYQYDVNASNFQNSRLRIATYDGHYEQFDGGIKWPSLFFTAQQAIDGKIYISGYNRYLHVIENPDVRGLGCNLRQHAIQLKTLLYTLPYYPNYDLGAVVDSCTRASIQESSISDISLYPNPASSHIVIQIPPQGGSGGFRNRNLKITLYNILGQNIPLPPFKGGITTHNIHQGGTHPPSPPQGGNGEWTLDVSHLPEGVYMLHIRDEQGELLKLEKIILHRE